MKETIGALSHPPDVVVAVAVGNDAANFGNESYCPILLSSLPAADKGGMLIRKRGRERQTDTGGRKLSRSYEERNKTEEKRCSCSFFRFSGINMPWVYGWV